VFPRPDPAVFTEVEDKVLSMLRDCLDRFAASTIGNGGTPRTVRGLAGGIVIALADLLPPIAQNFVILPKSVAQTSRLPWLMARPHHHLG